MLEGLSALKCLEMFTMFKVSDTQATTNSPIRVRQELHFHVFA